MCVIIDTNRLGDFLKAKASDDNSEMAGLYRLRNWAMNRGRIVYFKRLPKTKETARSRELRSNESAIRLLGEMSKEGGAEGVDYSDCVQSEEKFASKRIKSNDPHILALAEVSGASVLCTGDTMLMGDFKKHIKDGAVYPPCTKAAQKQMLAQKNICPRRQKD